MKISIQTLAVVQVSASRKPEIASIVVTLILYLAQTWNSKKLTITQMDRATMAQTRLIISIVNKPTWKHFRPILLRPLVSLANTWVERMSSSPIMKLMERLSKWMAKVKLLILRVTKIVSKMCFLEIKRRKTITALWSVDTEEASKQPKVHKTRSKPSVEQSILDSKVSN